MIRTVVGGGAQLVLSETTEIRPVVGGGGRTCLKQNLFHSRMIRPVVGGGGRTCLKQKKKELSTKATKALRLTATGYQGHERIIDFRLFHSRMIRPVGRGDTCLKQKKKELSTKRHEGPRRATKALRLTATGYQGRERMVDY